MTLRRLCKEYSALPSAVLAEDGGLLLQLLQVDGIVNAAEAEHVREQQDGAPGLGPVDWWREEVS